MFKNIKFEFIGYMKIFQINVIFEIMKLKDKRFDLFEHSFILYPKSKFSVLTFHNEGKVKLVSF